MVSRGGVSVSVERLAEPSRRTSCEEGRFESKLPCIEKGRRQTRHDQLMRGTGRGTYTRDLARLGLWGLRLLRDGHQTRLKRRCRVPYRLIFCSRLR